MSGGGCWVEAKDLEKVYPGGTHALKGIDVGMGPGAHAIMGPNGSGKTTFLSIVAGALAPTRGRVTVCGHDVWGRGWREARLATGYAPQDAPFRDRLTLLENLVWYGSLRGLSLGEARSRALELLELLDLREKAGERVQRLSGGMRRRAIIASALMAHPRVLLLDEPSSGLDPSARRELWVHIGSLLRRGLVETLLYTTHDALEAQEHSDRVYIFHRGELKARGAPGELIERYAPLSQVALVIHGSSGDLDWVGSVEGVEGFEERGGEVVAYTRRAPETMPRLIDEAIRRGLVVLKAEIRTPGLDEVFYRVTGERLEEQGTGGG